MSTELVELANETCHDLRKLWAMHGQVVVEVMDVDPDVVTVEVRTRAAKWRGFDLPVTVRNALVGMFRDLVPVPIARVIYTNEADGVDADVRFLPFYSEALLADGGSTEPLMLIEEVCAESREERRGAFEEAWKNSARS